MGTSNLIKTPYQGIPDFTKALRVNDVKSINDLDTLMAAMEAWNLFGASKRLQAWVNRMAYHIEREYEIGEFVE